MPILVKGDDVRSEQRRQLNNKVNIDAILIGVYADTLNLTEFGSSILAVMVKATGNIRECDQSFVLADRQRSST